MTPDDTTIELSPQLHSTRSHTIMKWLLWLGLGCTCLIVLLGLLLTYWFPSNVVRQELETRLSEILQGTVTIQTLSFNALTGLQANEVVFSKSDQPPLSLERLTLDYSLWGLLTGTFTINQVAIEQANISLNLPEITHSPPNEQTASPPDTTSSLPTFPVAIDLNSLAIVDSHVRVTVSPDLQVALSNVNLQSAGAISSENANLEGELIIDQLNVEFQGKQVQLPFELMFDTQLDLSAQHLNFEELTIISDPALRLTLSGTVSEFLTPKNIQLSLTETHFNLESLMKLVDEFMPSELATASIRGTFSPRISINGSLADTQFQGMIQAGLRGKELQVDVPAHTLSIAPTSLDIDVKNIHVHDNEPTEGTLTGNVTLETLTFQSYRLEDFNVALESEGHLSGPFSGTLNVNGTTNVPPDILGTSLTMPFDVNLKTSGNYRTRQANVKNLDVDLGAYGRAEITAELQTQPAPEETMHAAFEVHLSPKIDALLALLPKDWLQGIELQKGSEPDVLIVKAKADLHPDFRPQWGKATAAIKFSSLQAKSNVHKAEGMMNQLTFLLASDYQENNGRVQGTVGFSADLSNIRAAESMAIGKSHVILKSSFQGNLTPAYQPINLRSQDQLQLTLDDMTYQDASITATLPSLRLSTETKEDLFKKDFLLENFRLTSDEILDVRAKGQFIQANQEFNVDLHMPLLHVGNLLLHLSGPLMKGIDEIQPNGRVSLALRGAGQIPQAHDLKQLTLPFGGQGTLTLRNLEGAIAGYHIQDANGNVALAYSPQATPQTQLTTDLALNTILLPDTLPISELSDITVRGSLQSPNFNEVQIDPIRVTSKGMDLSLQGSMVGLREFLSSTTPHGTQLGKLFAQMQTHLGLDIETFQEALHPLGMKGTGKALLTMSMLKHEQGNLEASVKIDSKALSITRDDTTVRDMNGGIQFRKSLTWKPDGLKALMNAPFQPSDRIAQLKSLSRTGQTLTIKHLNFGPLTVQNLSTHLAFEQHTLKMQNLLMNLLGGGIGGNVIIVAERPLRISARFEVAHLDANQLITTQSRIQGDSNINATVEFAIFLQDATGAVDLSRLTCNLQITHIGKEALERLLVFLDPEGSNPTLSNAKAQLKLANPSRVMVEIARGQLNLTIHFQGSLIPTFQLDRVPIAKMKSLEALTAAIPNWDTLIQMLDMIAADSYSFSEDGDVLLK